MFTGLVQRIGSVLGVESAPDGATFHIGTDMPALVLGESIATQGVCLTVTRDSGRGFFAQASKETLAKSKLGAMRVGDRVHLERALGAGEKLGGHIVTGHVDGVGSLVTREEIGDACKVTFQVPDVLAPFLAPKGSITIDGVSLTVNGATGSRFDVTLVPFTRRETVFDGLTLGSPVNLEVDVLAKYVARLLGRPGVDGVAAANPEGSAGITIELLRDHGFV